MSMSIPRLPKDREKRCSSFKPARAATHPLEPRPRATSRQSPWSPPFLPRLLASPLAVFAEPDLQEDEAGSEHDADADQREREHLAGRAAHDDGRDRAGEDEQRDEAESFDAGAVGDERILTG